MQVNHTASSAHGEATQTQIANLTEISNRAQHNCVGTSHGGGLNSSEAPQCVSYLQPWYLTQELTKK